MRYVSDPPECRLSARFLNDLAGAAAERCVSDWDFAEWTHGRWESVAPHTAVAADGVATMLEAQLRSHGYVVVRLADLLDGYPPAQAAAAVTLLLTTLGAPLRVLLRHAHWRRLGVDVDRPPDASGGTGHQPFHIDFVNVEDPPDLVCLLCVRPDPLGGGASLVARIAGIEQLLDVRDIEVLRRAQFSTGVVENLGAVGADASPFPVLSPCSRWEYRFTTKLLRSATDNEACRALRAVAEILDARAVGITLGHGDLLILDQHSVTHGRGALGTRQETVPTAERRLLLQSFVRLMPSA